MKCAIILLACIATVHSYGYIPKRPDFDCDKWCKYRGVDPKCSESGKTFQNDCYLECAWEYKECDGTCPCTMKVKKESYCICPKTYQPVCTIYGETLDNKCVAECRGIPIRYEYKCPEFFN